jgi:hypothetical protein
VRESAGKWGMGVWGAGKGNKVEKMKKLKLAGSGPPAD